MTFSRHTAVTLRRHQLIVVACDCAHRAVCAICNQSRRGDRVCPQSEFIKDDADTAALWRRRGDICARAYDIAIVPPKESRRTLHNAPPARRGTITVTVTIMCVSAGNNVCRRPTSNKQSAASAAGDVIKANICSKSIESIVVTASLPRPCV